MKQCYKLVIPFIAIVFAGMGCTETEKIVQSDTLLLSTNSVAIAVEGGSRTIAVTSSGTWGAASSSEWIELLPDGQHLTIRAAANSDEAVRTAEVTISTPTKRETLSVLQEGNAGASALKVHYDSGKCTLDSEGAEFTATVIASNDWEVTVDNEWFSVEADKPASRFTVRAPANPGSAHQNTTVTVSSQGVTKTIALTQQIRRENPYYAFVGEWNWVAEKAYKNKSFFDKGTYASLQLVADQYNSIYKMLDIFINGSGLYVSFLPDKGVVNLPLGSSIGYNSSYQFYICACDITGTNISITFEGALEFSPSDNILKVSGINNTQYPYVGVIGFDGMNYVSFNDVYYLQTEGSTLTRVTRGASVQEKSNALQIEPNFGNIPRKRGFAVAIPE